MRFFDFTVDKLGGISKAIIRFFSVFLLLVTIAVLDAIAIENNVDYERQILALVLGIFSFLCAQILFERFGKTVLQRILLLVPAALITIGYYLYALTMKEVTEVFVIKTVTGIFALFIAFIWIPSIHRTTDFMSIFLSVFKAFFTSAFFSGIIFGGISLIIVAVDSLLTKVSENAYSHTANIVWVIWAPILFLSLIPVFANDSEDPEKIRKATAYPKFLEVLLSYVLIPLVSIYTLVLISYIFKTVAMGNWSGNLLEPLILSYLIAVLVLYVLVKNLDNIFTKIFRRVFPALLAAIALFQIISSVIKFTDDGMIHSRYFIMIFSIYALICGVVLFLKPTRKNNFIAPLAALLALVCILPAVGAFGISTRSQSDRLSNVLEKNNMLENGEIVPNADISADDKAIVSDTIDYLASIQALDNISFLPDKFDRYTQFNDVFGFPPYETYDSKEPKYREFSLDSSLSINAEGYSYFSTTYLSSGETMKNRIIGSVTKDGKTYNLQMSSSNEKWSISLKSEKSELINVSLADAINTIKGYSSTGKNSLKPDQLTFDFKNDAAKIRVVFHNIFINENSTGVEKNGEIYIFYSIK